ncbi:MAG TPA: lysophospholipid acyltransferase family protein [Candidatus Dormibacteraeota bacterium]
MSPRTRRTDAEDELRHELGLLYSKVSLELRSRGDDANGAGPSMPAVLAPDFGRAAADLTSLAVRRSPLLGSVVDFLVRQRELAARGPDADLDEFGFDREWTDSMLPIFQWLYTSYWRVQSSGIEHVPATGRALLVANHAGVLPWDGTMIKTAIMLEHPHPRHARALVANFFFGTPYLGWFLRRSGQTVGHPDDIRRLLERDELVLVFPEGVKGTGKPYRERYRLRRFGRGGFVQSAIRAGTPIIPISVVGSEDIYPMVTDLPAVAKALGMPYFPVTPTFPWLGPLGMIPLPSNWSIRFHPPVPTQDLDPELADDQNVVMQVAESVRETIQRGVWDGLRERRRTYL